jgi:hypothetical protein
MIASKALAVVQTARTSLLVIDKYARTLSYIPWPPALLSNGLVSRASQFHLISVSGPGSTGFEDFLLRYISILLSKQANLKQTLEWVYWRY